MSQIILSNVEQLKMMIEGKQFLLVRGSAYEHLEMRAFFDVYPHVEFSGYTSNPLYEQVCDGVDLFNKAKCELIVAIGGGSAIDVAKCIKLCCKMDKSKNYLEQDKTDTEIPLIAVPTTAGTGSESTRHAVIYYMGEKQSISHPSIVPDYVVLDASTLKNLPVYQKKCTMLDALCQAIESWWSVSATDESIEYSEHSIRLIKENWKEYIYENTKSSAERIMEAANYAGRAINITATTAAHAMSYKLTSLYQFPHGHAVAICLPEVWGYMLGHLDGCTDSRREGYLQERLTQIASFIDLNYFKDMLGNMQMKYPEASDKDSELSLLAASVNPLRLNNNPVGLSADVLREMYGRIVK